MASAQRIQDRCRGIVTEPDRSALMRRGVQADRQLCSGPGKLCQALGITRDQDGLLMRRSGARVVSAGERPAVVVTPRIGITKAADWPLRFVVDGSPWASRAPSPLA